MNKMIIIVRGGIVQEVYCTTNEIDLEIIDYDDADHDPNRAKALEDYVKETRDKELMKKVY